MKSKFRFLVSFSLKRKIMKKAFLISNIILCLLVLLISNLDTIIKSFGGDFDQVYTIYYQDDINREYFELFEYSIINGPYEAAEELIIINGDYALEEESRNIIVVEVLDGEELSAKISSNELFSTTLYSSLSSTLNGIKVQETALRLDVNQNDISQILKQIEVERFVVNDEGKSEESSLLVEGVTIVFIIPFFFGILMVVQMIGLEIFDEKSTRSMEVIMSSVEPKTHLKSKLVSVNLFAILQFLLLSAYGGIGFMIRSIVSKSSKGIPALPFSIDLTEYYDRIIVAGIIIVVVFILINLLYSLCMSILAATANELDDYQKIIAPVMILMILGFYTAIFAPLFDGALFSQIMAYIPFFTLMLAPGLYISGDISIIEVITMVSIQIVSILSIYSIGVPLYKQSVLDYSSEGVFKRFIKNLKRSRKESRH